MTNEDLHELRTGQLIRLHSAAQRLRSHLDAVEGLIDAGADAGAGAQAMLTEAGLVVRQVAAVSTLDSLIYDKR